MDSQQTEEKVSPPLLSKFARRLNPAHKRFIVKQVAAFVVSPKEITEMLGDPETAIQFGFQPVKITTQRIGQLIKRVDPKEVAAERERFLETLEDTPLAFKKVRLVELCKIFKSITGHDRGSNTQRLQVLEQIKAEIGEDVDKLADALRGGGDTHYHLAPATDGDRNLHAIFGANGNGNGDRFKRVISDN